MSERLESWHSGRIEAAANTLLAFLLSDSRVDDRHWFALSLRTDCTQAGICD